MIYNTEKRSELIAFFENGSGQAYTIDEICRSILPDGKGKSTVYRIVSELVEAAVVKRISDGKTRHCTYQYIGNEECHSHLHLKCRDCGQLIHLNDDISHKFSDSVLSFGGFTLEEGCLLFGKCKSCNPKSNGTVNDSSDSKHSHSR